MTINAPMAFQDQMMGNHCFGCGTQNEQGLHIKSYWEKDNVSICHFSPQQHHSSGPSKFLNGGIISTIIDCHCVCTSVALAYKNAGREIGEGDKIMFATGELLISFKNPVAISSKITLTAKIIEVKGKKITLNCTLESENEICAVAKVIAVKVGNKWADG